jgi:putative transposase
VKYRKALLSSGVAEIIKETGVAIVERYSIEAEGPRMDEDHIHLLSSAHPKMSIGEIVRIFRSITHGKYSDESRRWGENCGEENSGRTGTMRERLEKAAIGRKLRSMSESKEGQRMKCNRYACSKIPCGKPQGHSLPISDLIEVL